MTDTFAASPSTTEDAAAARLLRRVVSQWPLVIACALIAAVAGYFAANSRPKEYQATTVVQLNDINLSAVALNQNLQQQGIDATTKAATAAKLVSLPRVRDAAAQSLGGRVTSKHLETAIAVTAEPNTTLIDVTATASSPQLAADEANAMREAFITSRQQSTSASLIAARTPIQEQLNGLSAAERSSAAGVSLQTQIDQLNTLVNTAGSGVTTAQAATPPEDPSAPSPKRDAILALIAGGLLGLGIAVLRARLDDRIRDEKELTEHWDLPVLGIIPQTSKLGSVGAGIPSAAALEAFALTRTNLRYLHFGEDTQTVIVTSALPAEGKSTVAWNLALAAAMAEQRVLLIEADLRRPVLAQRLGLPSTRGLSELLAGMATADEVIGRVQVPVPGSEPAKVDIVPSGFIPPSPIALLERKSTAKILKSIGQPYDLVVIDSPPATVVGDAKVLLASADGAIVVTRLGRVTRTSIDRLRDILSGLNKPVLGTVVNSGATA
ncbi:MAG: polysaccharide biosynthesis tyrosine autokinase, partial [Solirubrobacteraceae bacterium]